MGEKVAFVFEGTLNKELFVGYLRVCLAPALVSGDVVVLDNSSVHTSKSERFWRRLGLRCCFACLFSGFESCRVYVCIYERCLA